MAQLRGTDGQPRTVPPLLLPPVILLWEEAASNALWFGGNYGVNPVPSLMVSALIVAARVPAWAPLARGRNPLPLQDPARGPEPASPS